MRFQVPQFIEVEDKIFGPLTFKQFIYVVGGGAVAVILFTLLPKFLAIIISTPIVLFALALAFYKVNNKPFIDIVEAFFKYSLTNKLYIWKKEDKRPVSKPTEEKPLEQVHVPKLSESRLKDLTWKLDVKESENPITIEDDLKLDKNIPS
ncbi:PrgI family protein [Candidatus Parcubacteria bacterium]|nr:PrgI family protein [Candidatus Parcubacteria bacterium]